MSKSNGKQKYWVLGACAGVLVLAGGLCAILLSGKGAQLTESVPGSAVATPSAAASLPGTNIVIGTPEVDRIAEQQKQEIENQTAIAKAEADRKVAVEKAQAEADALKISAQAEAEAKLIRAEAEAKANKIISESLTEQVIRAMFYETWDGVLPKVMSDGTLITSVDGYTGE